MQTQINRFPIQTRRLIRHKLDKHKKLQKLTSWFYLKYCNITGFSHILPDFLIIGFPKCGTTSLYEYLLQHPDIHPPIGKEIDYFDRLYYKGINWYKVRFPFKLHRFFRKNFFHRQFLTGEATPRYIKHPHSIYRIKNITPNAKFIVLLRNPIDRAYSHYNMNINNGYEYQSFESSIKIEEDRIKGRFEKMKNNPNFYSWDYDLFTYLTDGIYFDKLQIWFNTFPKNQFLIIQSEEFLKNPSKIYYQTLEFLNLDKWEPNHFKLYKKRSYKENKIEPEFRKYLQEFYKPHNEKLFKLIGKRYDWN